MSCYPVGVTSPPPGCIAPKVCIGTIREWSREEREYTVIPQAFKPRDATERRGDPDAEGGGIPEARGGIPRFEGLRDDRMFPNFEASFMNCHYLSKADSHKPLDLQYILVIRSFILIRSYIMTIRSHVMII